MVGRTASVWLFAQPASRRRSCADGPESIPRRVSQLLRLRGPRLRHHQQVPAHQQIHRKAADALLPAAHVQGQVEAGQSPPSRQFAMLSVTSRGSQLNAYAEILRFCKREKIQIDQFISPSHARQWELLNTLGLWPQWEAWKRTLVQTSHHIFGEGKYALYDFSGYNSFTTEPVPPFGSANQMAYYWESNHYTPALGNYVLDTLLSHQANSDPLFGIKLNKTSIEKALKEIEQKAQNYRLVHHDDISDLGAAKR